MALKKSTKGKKRAYDEDRESPASSSSLSPVPPDKLPVKRPKRAETRECPVCKELIPIRLLAAHAVLETKRVEEIIDNIGSTEVMLDEREEGSSARTRRSAVKARKAINPHRHGDAMDTVELSGKAIRVIKQHRKKRHAKLREMVKEDDESGDRRSTQRAGPSGEIVCPVCLKTVRGDEDVTDAHVDACLAHEHELTRLEEERNAEREREMLWQDGFEENVAGTSERIGNVSGLRGAGFHIRDRNEQDIEDEVDVDGDDEAVFGDVQFTEGDILTEVSTRARPPDANEDLEVEIEGDSDDEAQREQKTLRDLVAEGKVVKRRTTTPGGSGDVEAVKAKMEEVMGVGDADKMDIAVNSARRQGNPSALVIALDEKVKHLESVRISSSTSLLCRICLDPYNEPTVSTGCWHTCCRECWLRCLGSTKLCPICKRITGATELRRIYL